MTPTAVAVVALTLFAVADSRAVAAAVVPVTALILSDIEADTWVPHLETEDMIVVAGIL